MIALTNAQVALKTKISTGLYSFSDLSDNEKSDLADWLIPDVRFDESHKLMMEGLYLLIPEGADLDQINSGRNSRISSRATLRGEIVTNVSLLTDMSEGSPYYWARRHLSEWKIVALPEDSFPSIN